MRKISRASDSIWVTAAGLDDYADAQYQMHKAVSDAHRADAAKLSDHELQNHYDNLADDIELDKHNQYDFFNHLIDNAGSIDDVPERTHQEQSHDDLVRRHQAFGDELDARGLWGPKLELHRQKFRQRVEDWPKTRAHQARLVEQGILTPEHEAFYGDDKAGFDKYMAHGGFRLADVKSMTAKYREHQDRQDQRKVQKWFGPGGFDNSNPEHRAITHQLLKEYDEKKRGEHGGH